MGTKPRFEFGRESVSGHDRALHAEQAVANQVIEGYKPQSEFLLDVQAHVDGKLSIDDCIAKTLARHGVGQ